MLWLSVFLLLCCSTTLVSTSSAPPTAREFTPLISQQQQQQQKTVPWRIPWVLHSILSTKEPPTSVPNAFLPWKITTASFLKLRGGSSNTSEVGTTSSSNNNNKARSKRDHRKHKSKDNRNHRKDKEVEEDVKVEEETIEDADADADKETPEEASSSSSSSKEKKLFLMDPFRMNEMARHEASLMEDETDSSSEEEALEEPSAEESPSSPSEENEDDSKRNGRNHKNGKKKIDRTKTKAAKEEEIETALEVDASQNQTLVEANNYTKVDAGEPTDESSNSYWWVDVWTQHLSDPEEEPQEEGVDMDVAADILQSDESTTEETDSNEKVEDDEKEAVPKTSREGVDKRRNRKRKDKEDRLNVKSIESSSSVEADAGNVTVSSDADGPLTPDANTSSLVLSGNETVVSVVEDENDTTTVVSWESSRSYVSSGAWVPIDNLLTIGLASKFSSLRLSRKIRRVRKVSARITGLHGLLSGKPSMVAPEFSDETTIDGTGSVETDDESIQSIQKQIAAIDKARERVERAEAEEKARRRKRSFFGLGPREKPAIASGSKDEEVATSDEEETDEPKVPQKSPEEIEEEFQRMERVREIDMLISEGQKRLADLICEKDVLQRRPNPLFNYTTVETVVTTEVGNEDENNNNLADSAAKDTNVTTKVEIQATREMNFPPDDLVAEYLDMMLSTRRLTKMNHTQLWRESENDDEDEDDEDESIGDDLFTPSADVHRLYERSPSGSSRNGKRNGKKGGGGSWFLRQSIGNGPTLGEKIGQAAETAAYKAITAALMSFLARTISSLHGINVMKHSDIRLFLEQSPDLPPLSKDGIIRGDHNNYAEETIKNVMRRKSRRSKKRSSKRRLSEDFVQQEAVTETLLSHVQISAPLLKLFPLAWQRALLGNIIALACALISDFLDGLHFQILGHELSFAFRPITEVDMARHFQMAGGRFNQRRYKAAEFEAAIQATAEDLKEELKFLDSWHERALGSGVLRTQIADMIARIVLTLTDDVLSGARMDLWSAQAGGPRMLAGLEHRIEEER